MKNKAKDYIVYTICDVLLFLLYAWLTMEFWNHLALKFNFLEINYMDAIIMQGLARTLITMNKPSKWPKSPPEA